jgi:hypothetical protein
MKISQRIELLQKEYFGEPKEIDRGHFLWEEFLVFLGVDEECKKLDGSDAELLRRAYEIAVNLSRRFTTRERGESLGSMFTRFWAQRAASENGPEMPPPAVPPTLENLIAADWKEAELNMKTNPRRTRTR